MAENIPPSSLPPPPTTAGAPGYEGPPGSASHEPQSMPPPTLPPMVIPQNNNPVPTEFNPHFDPTFDHDAVLSPGGTIRRAAPEPNKRALYIGGLDPRVTEEVLKQIFETTGHVVSVKIIPDKNYNSKGFNYGFVEYDDPGAADRAMNTLNGRRVHQQEIRVNWAYQSNSSNKEDTSNHFHIFVGDLSNEVNDEVLSQAFSAFGSVSEARVMWDMKTGRTRGYGFVAFRERSDADKALNSMDGEWLGSRAIRCNWANQKGQPSISAQQAMQAMGMTPTTPFGHHHFPTQGVQSYEMVVNQTPTWQTTCYVGNLTPYTTQADLIPLFQNFGYVVETRFQSDRGFAFIKMDSHENAAMAICQLSGYNVNGRPLKCSVSDLVVRVSDTDRRSGVKTVLLPDNSTHTLRKHLPWALLLLLGAHTIRHLGAPTTIILLARTILLLAVPTIQILPSSLSMVGRIPMSPQGRWFLSCLGSKLIFNRSKCRWSLGRKSNADAESVCANSSVWLSADVT